MTGVMLREHVLLVDIISQTGIDVKIHVQFPEVPLFVSGPNVIFYTYLDKTCTASKISFCHAFLNQSVIISGSRWRPILCGFSGKENHLNFIYVIG